MADTPPEFGVRVGLFGEWGSGKSSILKFVQRLLEARDHSVVRFSPWGLSDPSEVWSKLGKELIDQLGEKRGSRLTRAKFRYSKEIKQGVRAGKSAAPNLGLPHGQLVGAVAGPALDWLEKLLSVTGDQLADLANPGERIVVLIDDVDRTDPTLVPQILFALREVFDIPRFSWVLAIDPVVVRAALEAHHPGFALGRDYLEKVAHFPFVIGPPEPARRVALVLRD